VELVALLGMVDQDIWIKTHPPLYL
jgi:hypothetical protein